MSTSVTDETANRDQKIRNAVNVIGKSRDRLQVFEAICFGKIKTKTQKNIYQHTGLSAKRILEEGRKLSTERIIKQVKDITKKTAYEKIDFYCKNKNQIISLVNKNLKHKISSRTAKDIVNTKKIKRNQGRKSTKNKKYDVFISHASEDKKRIVTPLVDKLKQRNIETWYDQSELKWGDSLVNSINSGLKNSLYGIVIFSNAFFKKAWPKTELHALVSLTNTTGEKKILPLLYGITHKKLVKNYPILADIVARSWKDGLDNLADEVKAIINEKKLH